MRRIIRLASLAVAATFALCAGVATAQNFTGKTIRIIVPFAAGGNTDVTGRLYATRISQRLGQPVVVENRSGATGAIGTEAVIRARPDGYMLLIGSPGSIVNGPLQMANPRCNTFTDLVPVALLGGDCQGLADGRLADVAPTLLALLGLPKPLAMTGESLLR